MKNNTPKSLYSSTISILGIEIVVHVLNNGKRIIEKDSMKKLLEAMLDPNKTITEEDAMKLAKFIKGVN